MTYLFCVYILSTLAIIAEDNIPYKDESDD